VTQLLEAHSCKPEGRKFVSRRYGIFHWLSFQPHYGPEIDSVSNGNE